MLDTGRFRPALAAALALLAGGALAAAGPRSTVVFCAPGSPGTTEEAQGAMDAFAGALAAGAGVAPGSLAATYAATEEAGTARLRAPDAAVAMVSLPFFLKHERTLALRAELQAVTQGGATTERWSLVARKGKYPTPASLDGVTLVSSAGFAPAFVRGPALGGWGKLPASLRITQSSAVLSALRRAAAGEPVAVLLDGAQSAALASLPFAADLEVLTQSPPLPTGVVATVGRRLPPSRWAKLAAALKDLPSKPEGEAALAGIRLSRFVDLDRASLSKARAAHAEASR